MVWNKPIPPDGLNYPKPSPEQSKRNYENPRILDLRLRDLLALAFVMKGHFTTPYQMADKALRERNGQ